MEEEKTEEFHYLVGVRINNFILSNNVGKHEMDFFFEYGEEELNNVRLMKSCYENKLFGCQDHKELFKIFDSSGKLREVGLLSRRVACDNIMTCHFKSEIKIDRETMRIYIENSDLKKLIKARVNI